jgi:hypothetical protein
MNCRTTAKPGSFATPAFPLEACFFGGHAQFIWGANAPPPPNTHANTGRAQLIWGADGKPLGNVTYPKGLVDPGCQGSIVRPLSPRLSPACSCVRAWLCQGSIVRVPAAPVHLCVRVCARQEGNCHSAPPATTAPLSDAPCRPGRPWSAALTALAPPPPPSLTLDCRPHRP